MRYLGVDPGTKRVGLALSDPLGLVASPHSVVPADAAVDVISALVRHEEVVEIVVGLPRGIDGREGSSAEKARELGDALAVSTEARVTFADERFTSRMAEKMMIEGNVSRRDRRKSLDKVAAAILLQDHLDALGQGESE